MKRHVIISVSAIACIAFVVCSIALCIALAPFSERKRDADRALLPLLDLKPEILDNAFGVYVVAFYPTSLLNDNNASRLLQLNELPSKYDLTLVLETDKITDASILTLANLITTDLIIARDSGMTDAGIAKLGEMLPSVRVPRRTNTSTNSQPADNHGSHTERGLRPDLKWTPLPSRPVTTTVLSTKY